MIYGPIHEIDVYELLQTRSSVPPGNKGDWKVERFVVDRTGAMQHNFREIARGFSESRFIVPGVYTRLVRNDTVVMSDTPAERAEALDLLREATGKMLINGLGLGWTIEACIQKPSVDHITVVEISPDVIELTGKYLQQKFPGRLTIIQHNALTYKAPRGQCFDVVWHDIWDDIVSDNYEQMKTLHRKYGRRCGWQGSWCREEVVADLQ